MIIDKIYEAKDGIKVSDFKTGDMTKFVKFLTTTLGCPIHSDDDELQYFIRSLRGTHGHFTGKEFSLAIELMQQGQLQCEIDQYRPVSSQAIGKLMNAYRMLKSETLVKYGRFSPEAEIPEDQKEEILRRGVIRIYNEWLKDETYLIERLFVFYPYVNYLKRRGIISISEHDKQEARKVAEEIAPQMQLKKTIVSRIVKPEQSDIEKYMEYYYLFMYFKSCKLLNKSVA